VLRKSVPHEQMVINSAVVASLTPTVADFIAEF
jgi:hypothetical protein